MAEVRILNGEEVIDDMIVGIREDIGDGLEQGAEYLRANFPVKTGALRDSVEVTDNGIEFLFYGVYAANDIIEEAVEVVSRTILQEDEEE